MFRFILAALLCAVACLSQAFAHITLEQKMAVAGSTYKGIFRVGHGCDGSATTAISVFLPEGVIGAKPMPKAGWKLDIRNEKLAAPSDSRGNPIGERVAQISWSGGSLRDTEYDEFIINMSLPATPGKRWFRILQQCETGQQDWAAVPDEGERAPRFPAAALDILPASAADPHAHHH